MTLSVCWISRDVLVTTYSNGGLTQWKVDEHGEPQVTWLVPDAHAYEAWTATFSPDGK
jgi:hypothetical protein